MSTDQPNQSFDDPGFRRALRAQLGKETAPLSLRARVVSALDEAESSTTTLELKIDRAPRRMFARPLVGLAIAASLLLVAEVTIWQMTRRPIIELPAQLAADMTRQHDICASAADHVTLGPTTGDLAAVSKQLTEKLRIPVLVAMIDGGWKFEGARVCPLGIDRAGHLLFTRGEQSLSVFSVPGRAAYWPTEGAHYQTVVNGHPIAGFVRKHNMYCIVGTSPKNDLTLKDLEAIRDQLEESFRAG